jgi:flagellar protein FlaG
MQEKAIINTIERANKKISGSSMEFEFSVHEQTKQILIKVINSQTKEIVREIPSEKILDMVANMCELAGLFVDEKR